ncbi:hypothetical protein LCGC14_0814610 [marine sediment metagenome]|uniref:Uncharacterized protein n=1 Tax=marine sediment metagenome TaxID=412755 RepID=A0A0F9PKM3_9ZZZZ
MRTVTLTAAAQSIYAILGVAKTTRISLQALDTNGAKAFFGNNDQQLFFMNAGESVLTPVMSTKNLWVKGTPGDSLIVGAL